MRAFVITVVTTLLLIGCSPGHLTTRRTTNLCMTNMMAIWWELKYWNFDGDSYPPSFDSLSKTSNPALFICPSSGHAPGSMTNVNQWTDYIYLSGAQMDSSMLLDVATLICPPENHGGQYGHVVWGGGGVVRLPPDQIRALIKEPWSKPTSGRASIRIYGPGGTVIPFAEHMRTNTTLHVPERFRTNYTQWQRESR